MPFSYNAGNMTPSGFVEIPDGEYILKIVSAQPGTTQNGDDKVTVDYEIAAGSFKGEQISYHNITFFKDTNSKGAGIALNFLKCIGEPYEGQFEVDEKNWLGRRVKAMVTQEVQQFGKSAGKKFPRIKWVNQTDQVKEEEIPF